eukprot:195488-Ditylum_brightwellii.AAC.1
MFSYQEYLDTKFGGTQHNLSVIGQIFAAELYNENYTLKEMMQQLDRKDFEAAMFKEAKHMFDNKVWEKVPRKEMEEHYKQQRKQGTNIKRKQLMLIWLFKRKCHADESLSKRKVGLCCHGGQQQWRVNFYEIYAPVVAWASVRTMVVMSNLYNLNTRSIDFILAYPKPKSKLTYTCFHLLG